MTEQTNTTLDVDEGKHSILICQDGVPSVPRMVNVKAGSTTNVSFSKSNFWIYLIGFIFIVVFIGIVIGLFYLCVG